MDNDWFKIDAHPACYFISAPCRVDVKYNDGREYSFCYPDQLEVRFTRGEENQPVVIWPHIKDRGDAYITHIRKIV
jgi:hypothetical protein